MARLTEMPGKRILRSNGLLMGTVEACVLEPFLKQVMGYRCRGFGYRQNLFYVAQSQVAYISDRYLGLKPAFAEDPGVYRQMKNCEEAAFSVLGLEVYSAEGAAFGRVGDMVFSEETGRFESVVLSDGLMKDLLFGRRRLKLPRSASMKQNGIVLTGPVDLSEEIRGGLMYYLGRRG